jgi:hypothetical protein
MGDGSDVLRTMEGDPISHALLLARRPTGVTVSVNHLSTALKAAHQRMVANRAQFNRDVAGLCR